MLDLRRRDRRVSYTAFVSKPKHRQVAATLIVRRVKRPGTGHPQGQGELFATYRFHAVFTDSPLTVIEAEKAHRQHAIVEQVIADVKGSALAHAPSGQFNANAAWLPLACLAYNLTRAAGAIASVFHARATTATIRADLIEVPARLASSGPTTNLASSPALARRTRLAPTVRRRPRHHPLRPDRSTARNDPSSTRNNSGKAGQTSWPPQRMANAPSRRRTNTCESPAAAFDSSPTRMSGGSS